MSFISQPCQDMSQDLHSTKFSLVSHPLLKTLIARVRLGMLLVVVSLLYQALPDSDQLLHSCSQYDPAIAGVEKNWCPKLLLDFAWRPTNDLARVHRHEASDKGLKIR
jgi:hypothetical protein